MRGARGLGAPEVCAGACGNVVIAPAIGVPATITAVTPGRAWEWRVGPVTMRHGVSPRPGGCEITLELSAGQPLQAAIAVTYGPLVTLLLANLARVAAREHARGGRTHMGG